MTKFRMTAIETKQNPNGREFGIWTGIWSFPTALKRAVPFPNDERPNRSELFQYRTSSVFGHSLYSPKPNLFNFGYAGV